jgi:hypothetical protein
VGKTFAFRFNINYFQGGNAWLCIFLVALLSAIRSEGSHEQSWPHSSGAELLIYGKNCHNLIKGNEK